MGAATEVSKSSPPRIVAKLLYHLPPPRILLRPLGGATIKIFYIVR